MIKRKKMTANDVINKEIYRAIIFIISSYEKKKIRFYHLRYKLVEHHQIKLTHKKEKELEAFFGHDVEDAPFFQLMNLKIKGKRGINNLNNFLKRLIEMKMIEKHQKTGDRFPYYTVTQYGQIIGRRWMIKWMVDELIPDEALLELALKVGEVQRKWFIKNYKTMKLNSHTE